MDIEKFFAGENKIFKRKEYNILYGNEIIITKNGENSIDNYEIIDEPKDWEPGQVYND